MDDTLYVMSNPLKIVALLFTIAIPVFFLTGSVAWTVNDLHLQKYAFEKYEVPKATGIDIRNLMDISEDIRQYFNSSDKYLILYPSHSANNTQLLNSKEVSHMHDVKLLIWGVYALLMLSGSYLIAGTCVGIAIIGKERRSGQVGLGKRFTSFLSKCVMIGSGITISTVILVSLGCLLAFDTMFLLFHRLSFRNDLWQLDSNDFLILMFPQEFWFAATVFVAISCIALATTSFFVSLTYFYMISNKNPKPQ